MGLSLEDAEDIRRIARRFAGRYPYPDLDDLIQEGTIRARDVLAGLNVARGTRKAYLRACVSNRFRDIVRKEIRRARRHQPLDESHGGIPCPRAVDPVLLMIARAQSRDVARATLDLPPAEASVVTLMLQGADDVMIVEITARPIDAVYCARTRAVQRLRHILVGERAA